MSRHSSNIEIPINLKNIDSNTYSVEHSWLSTKSIIQHWPLKYEGLSRWLEKYWFHSLDNPRKPRAPKVIVSDSNFRGSAPLFTKNAVSIYQSIGS